MIFTIKYWTLSRRLIQIYSGKEDKYLNIKAQAIFYTFLLSIIVTSIFFVVELWNMYDENKSPALYYSQILQFLPDLALVALMVEAV